jgi:hypothetical protein
MAKTDILEKVVLKGFKGVFSRKKNSINNSGYYRLFFFYIRKKLILTMKIIEMYSLPSHEYVSVE